MKTPFSFFLSPNTRDKINLSTFGQGNKARGEIPMKYLPQTKIIKSRYRIPLLKSFVKMDYSLSFKNNEKRDYFGNKLENHKKIKSN